MSIKVSEFSGVFHRALLQAGNTTGLDTTAAGAAVGAVAGGIQGSFSDYGGLFGGATKGAIAGGFGGVGLKYAGSKYSKGFGQTFGKFDEDAISSMTSMTKLDRDAALQARLSPNTKHLSTGKFSKGESWFDTQYSAFDDYKAAGKYANSFSGS